MAKIDILAPFIFSWEGGYVNHLSDRGGATNMGVTIATYRSYCAHRGLDVPTVVDLKKMTANQAEDILRTMYWDRVRADEILNQSVANIIVDWFWASGVWGVKFVQRALDVVDDGVVGSITLGAINSADASMLFNALWRARELHFMRIAENDPSQCIFLRGWLNRLSGLQFGRLVCNGGEEVVF